MSSVKDREDGGWCGRGSLTCEFAAVPFGIFTKTLKNGVDARLEHAEKE
jgi:hypothetical protein